MRIEKLEDCGTMSDTECHDTLKPTNYEDKFINTGVAEADSNGTMDSTALMVRHSREPSMDEGPPKSRPPPDGHEFPAEFQDPDISDITGALRKPMPVPRPRSSLPNRDNANGKPPLWSRRDEKSDKSVRAKIALFSNDETPRISPVRLARSPSGEGRVPVQRLASTGQDLSRSVDNLNKTEPPKRVVSPQPLSKSRRSLQEKSQSLLDVATASGPRRSLSIEPRGKNDRKFSALVEARQKSMSKLKGLVIPDVESVLQTNSTRLDLPEIISKDSIFSTENSQHIETSQKISDYSQTFPRKSNMNVYKSQNLSTVHARLEYINDSGIQENDNDTDNDSAVSSSRSSMSPPPSPPPHYSDTCTITPDKDEPRVLKPDSVEALNRRNVLRSARFSNGAKSDDETPPQFYSSHQVEPPQKEFDIQVAFVTDVTDSSRPSLPPSPRRIEAVSGRRYTKEEGIPPIPTQRSFLKVNKDDVKEDSPGKISRTSSFSRLEVSRPQKEEAAPESMIPRTSSFSKRGEESPRSFSPLSTRSLDENRKAAETTESLGRLLRPSPTSSRRLAESPTFDFRRSSFSQDETLRVSRLSPVPAKRSEDHKVGDRRLSATHDDTVRVVKTSPSATRKLEETSIKVEESSKTFEELTQNSETARLDEKLLIPQFRKRESPSPTSIKALTQRFEQITVDKLTKNGKPLDSRTASVNDIRRAFEKAEKSLSNSDDCEGTSPINQSPPTTLRRYNQQPHGIFTTNMSYSSSHARVSSIDSTTSEDSSLPNMNLPSVRDHFGSITSLASTTSLISPQELQQLIEDANQSLEESGTPCHEIVVVVLHRNEPIGGVSMSLGITLAGGADHEMKEITVHKIISGSTADRDGRIQRGDRVLSVNGRSLKGVTHREALQILKAPRPEVVLVLSRSRSSTPLESSEEVPQSSARTLSISPMFNSSRPPRILESPGDVTHHVSDQDSNDGLRGEPLVTAIYKDGSGLGFSLEGGKDSPLGDKPLTIKKIFAGGTAAKCEVLRVGDQILAVNGNDVRSLSRLEAWNLMKKLPDGEVNLTVAQLKTPK